LTDAGVDHIGLTHVAPRGACVLHASRRGLVGVDDVVRAILLHGLVHVNHKLGDRVHLGVFVALGWSLPADLVDRGGEAVPTAEPSDELWTALKGSD